MDLVIKNGLVVTASDMFRSDIGVSGGKIAALGTDLPGDRTIDAAGKMVLPGMVDVHVHMQLPFGGTVSADDFSSGTIAAACGGVTTIVDFAIQARGETLAEAIKKRRQEADGRVAIDYGLHACITDMRPEVMEEMKDVIRAGYPTFKLFMTYAGLAVDDGTLYAALQMAGENGGMVGVHAENYKVIEYRINRLLAEGKTEPRYHAESRPVFCEEEAVSRAVTLAAETGSPLYIFHLSSARGLARIIAARDMGHPVFCETCPQYLVLDESCYEEGDFGGAKYVMSPPLRRREDQDELWRGLMTGHVQVVGSDHCPFTFEQKKLGLGDFTRIPNGAPGVETTLALLHAEGVGRGRFGMNRLVEVFATNPARLFGLSPDKGTIAVGADADLVVFDPNREVTLSARNLHMQTDYSPYEGRRVRGYPVMTISRGRVVCEDGRFIGDTEHGRFVARRTFRGLR